MGFSKLTTNLNNHQSLSDEPNLSDGITAEQLKVLYDKAPNDIKTYINNLIDAINDKTSAGNVGAKSVSDETISSNVQAELDYLLSQLQGIVLDQIPDGTIIEAKMNNTYANSLAKKSDITDIGEIRRFSSEVSKNGYLLCDGAYINKTDYPEMLDKLVDGIGKYYNTLSELRTALGSDDYDIIKYGDYYIAYRVNQDKYVYSTDLVNWNSKVILSGNSIKNMTVINNTLFAIVYSGSNSNFTHRIYKFTDIITPIEKKAVPSSYSGGRGFAWDTEGNIILVLYDRYLYSSDNGDTFATYSDNGNESIQLGVPCYNNGYFYFLPSGQSTTNTTAKKIAVTDLSTVIPVTTNITFNSLMDFYVISKNNYIYIWVNDQAYIYKTTDLTDIVTINTFSVTCCKPNQDKNNFLILNSNRVNKLKDATDELDYIYTSERMITSSSYMNYIIAEIDDNYFEYNNGVSPAQAMTNFKKLELPSITNSSENGYHYIKVSEVN